MQKQMEYGLDSNNHLFKELNDEVIVKLEKLKKNIAEINDEIIKN